MEQFYAKADADAKAHRAFSRGMWLGVIFTLLVTTLVNVFF